jgi:hypothetical protein
MQRRVVGVEFRYGFHPAGGIAFAENPCEVACIRCRSRWIERAFWPSRIRGPEGRSVVKSAKTSLACPVATMVLRRLPDALFDSAVGSTILLRNCS